MKLTNIALIAAMGAGIAAPALAQTTEARAATALTLRAAPSGFSEVVGGLDADQAVAIEGCLEDVTWCKVNVDGTTGWASGQYLLVDEGTDAVTLLDAAGNAAFELQVNTIPTDQVDVPSDVAAAAAGSAVGALTAYALGGPIGAIALSAVGGAVAGGLCRGGAAGLCRGG